MIEEARKNNKVRLKNSTLPDLPPLPEADQEDMEVFFDHIKLLLLSLGIRVFEIVEFQKDSAKIIKIIKFTLSARGANASGYNVSDGFLVEKNSTAVSKDNPSLQKWYIQQKNKLVQADKLKYHSDELYMFTEDVIFSSPSAAAAIVAGQPMSGPQTWKTKGGLSYKEYIEELIDSKEPFETNDED